MKTILKIIPVIAMFIACTPSEKNKNVEELKARRDSLQAAQLKIMKDINDLNTEISLADTSNTTDELKLIKKIGLQRNKVVSMSKKLKKLENELASLNKVKKLVPVAVKEIQPEPFNNYIVVYGNVEADNYAMISPEMNGRIENIYVTNGQHVSKGQLLLSLNTDAINKQIKGTKSGLELASTTYEKQKTLWDKGIGSELQYLTAKNTKETLEAQLEALEAQLRMAQIRAPFDGTVDKIFPKKGEMAGPAMPVIEFVSLGSMTIKADISEKYIEQVKKGHHVELTFSSLPGYTVSTSIVEVSKVINPVSRTFEIELQINNPGEKIKPNMVSTIKINVFTEDKAFVVPSLAIRKDISGRYVYLANEKDGQQIVEKRPIKTSLSYEDNTMVTDGLSVDDKVIVKGYHLVSAGMHVKVVE